MEQGLTGAVRMQVEVAELQHAIIEDIGNDNKPSLRTATAMANVDYARALWLIEARERSGQGTIEFEQSGQVPTSFEQSEDRADRNPG